MRKKKMEGRRSKVISIISYFSAPLIRHAASDNGTKFHKKCKNLKFLDFIPTTFE